MLQTLSPIDTAYGVSFFSRPPRAAGNELARKAGFAIEALEGRLFLSFAQPDSGVPGSVPFGAAPGAVHGSVTSSTPPSLSSVVIGDGTPQRSIFNSFTLVFSQPVTLAPGAVTLSQVTTDSSGTILTSSSAPASAFSIANPSADGQTWVAQVTPGGALDGGHGTFKDGIYQYVLHAALITNGGGMPLGGGDQNGAFRKIFGDFNGDGKISNSDFTQFSNTFGSHAGDINFRSVFDFNFDNQISNSDFTQFSNRFGMALALPVNHAPMGTDNTVTATENSGYAFAIADFGFSDPHDPVPNSLRAVKISTIPVNGSLTDNGAVVAAGQFIPAADIATGGLIFTPALNQSGPGYASFAFQVQDDGGVANGGVDLDPIPRTMTVNVTPTAPSNDNLVNAIALTGSAVITTGTNAFATKEPSEPNHAGNPGGASVWWKWTAPVSGYVTVSTAGSTFDTLLGAYRGSNVTSLARVASNDDNPSGGTTSIIRFKAIAGATYDIAVDGYNGVTGNVSLSLTLSATTYAGLASRVASTGQWFVAKSNGSGFTTSLWGTWDSSVNWVDAVKGDFNGDGRTDIAARNAATGQWYVAISNGGGFTTSVWDAWSPSVNWADVRVGDFNGDGRDDIAGRNSATGEWFVATSKGGAFSTSLWDTWSSAVTWSDVLVGDFNNDGRSDIVGRNAATGQWWVATATGSQFSNGVWDTWSPSANWVNVQVGDFNGDGRSDLVGRDANTGQWWVATSNGISFSTSLWSTWSPSVTWVDVKVGDFNGDGRSDIIGRDSATGGWWVGTSSGTAFNTTLWGTWSPTVNWSDVQIGDFNGDGRDEITGRDPATGKVWVAISSGSGFNTTLWDTWSPAVTWADTKSGYFVG